MAAFQQNLDLNLSPAKVMRRTGILVVPGCLVRPKADFLRIWSTDKSFDYEVSPTDRLLIDGLDRGQLLLVLHDPEGEYLLVLVEDVVGYVIRTMVYAVL